MNDRDTSILYQVSYDERSYSGDYIGGAHARPCISESCFCLEMFVAIENLKCDEKTRNEFEATRKNL